jgi:3-phenylpropionate/trans-cinnamate dioxygenase ferredoxin reductase subunit
MTEYFDIVIVGAGHAGAQVAIMLREQNYDGTIVLIEDEPEFPYERPPLSKEYFAGEKPFERILIRPANFWNERQIEMRLRTRVMSVDAIDRSVMTDAGKTYGYNKLI